MSIWTAVNVNGVLADSLVADFGAANAPTTTPMPPDSELCLRLHYSSTAATQVQIFLATAGGAAGQNIVMAYDSAFQTNPAANSTQFITGLCVDVPIIQGTQQPLQLRITKGNSTAIIRWKTVVKMGACC